MLEKLLPKRAQGAVKNVGSLAGTVNLKWLNALRPERIGHHLADDIFNQFSYMVIWVFYQHFYEIYWQISS